MRKLLLSLILIGIFGFPAFARVPRKTVQKKVELSDTVAVAEVIELNKGNKIKDKNREEWWAKCRVIDTLKGNGKKEFLTVRFLLLPKGVECKPSPEKLFKGKKYLFYLKGYRKSCELISPYHGAFEVAKEYWEFDEDAKEDPAIMESAHSFINGVPCVKFSHEQLMEKIKRIGGNGKEKLESYCYSICAKCSKTLKSETTEKSTETEILEGTVSKWLSPYIEKDCDHQWIPVSGWSAKDNLNWSGHSLWYNTLDCIRRLKSVNNEKQTKQLLARYFEIHEVKDKAKQIKDLTQFKKELGRRLVEAKR